MTQCLSGEKWGKVVKSSEKWEKMVKSWKKWGKVGKSGEKWWNVGKSREKWGKGLWRPFWMTENHFRLHFSPFQINTQLFFFKMAASSHFGSRFLPKSTIGTDLYSRSVARSNMKLIGAFLIKLWSAQAFSSYFHKMAVWRPFWFSDFLQNR